MNLQEIKQDIENQIDKEWQEKYDISSTAKHYKSVEPKVTRKLKFTSTFRDKDRLITRLRLGKCCLNFYLHEMNLHSTGFCEHCQKSETIQHFLMECPNADIFVSKTISMHAALTDPENIEHIFEKLKQLKRRL